MFPDYLINNLTSTIYNACQFRKTLLDMIDNQTSTAKHAEHKVFTKTLTWSGPLMLASMAVFPNSNRADPSACDNGASSTLMRFPQSEVSVSISHKASLGTIVIGNLIVGWLFIKAKAK